MLLQASIEVFKNSISGFAVATFELLCRIELLGNLLCCMVGSVVMALGGTYSSTRGFNSRRAPVDTGKLLELLLDP